MYGTRAGKKKIFFKQICVFWKNCPARFTHKYVFTHTHINTLLTHIHTWSQEARRTWTWPVFPPEMSPSLRSPLCREDHNNGDGSGIPNTEDWHLELLRRCGCCLRQHPRQLLCSCLRNQSWRVRRQATVSTVSPQAQWMTPSPTIQPWDTANTNGDYQCNGVWCI